MADVVADAVAEQPGTAMREQTRLDQVVRWVGDHSTDEALLPVSLLTGRPVHTRRRRFR